MCVWGGVGFRFRGVGVEGDGREHAEGGHGAPLGCGVGVFVCMGLERMDGWMDVAVRNALHHTTPHNTQARPRPNQTNTDLPRGVVVVRAAIVILVPIVLLLLLLAPVAVHVCVMDGCDEKGGGGSLWVLF